MKGESNMKSFIEGINWATVIAAVVITFVVLMVVGRRA
jgi:hypothetical protein